MSQLNLDEFGAYSWIPEPRLSFHPDRPDDVDIHPLNGLTQYGPWSSTLPIVSDPIRLAAIYPDGFRDKTLSVIDELNDQHFPKERPDYLPKYPGFRSLYGRRLACEDQNCIELDPQLFQAVASAADNLTARRILLLAIESAMREAANWRARYDVIVIVLPSCWEPLYDAYPEEPFDLHAYIKGMLASFQIPSQIVREEGALSYHCRCSVMWALSIALYVKAGGIPWKLANSSEVEAQVGIAYALRPRNGTSSPFVTCCSQIFDAGGYGPRFLSYEAPESHVDRDNPFLSRSDMFRVVSRSLEIFRRRNQGESPSRLSMHKTTHFTNDEIEGCFDAWRKSEGLDLLQVQTDSPWQAGKYEAPKSAAKYPVDRGAMLQLGSREFLLWVQGNSKSQRTNRNYFQERKGIPKPLLIRRFAGHTSFETLASEIIGLSKMNWNSDNFYSESPVTLLQAQTVAKVFKQPLSLGSHEHDFRLFM